MIAASRNGFIASSAGKLSVLDHHKSSAIAWYFSSPQRDSVTPSPRTRAPGLQILMTRFHDQRRPWPLQQLKLVSDQMARLRGLECLC